MKRILLALTMTGLLLALAPRAQAATEVSLDFFYDNLSSQGSWIEVADYGYCFQPNVALNNSDWRPYSDGYWAYTDAGWTWVSYEDFGWATYHYGRWANLADYGWVWVPGYEWGPAWVSWRTGGDYVGWAPLPPGGATVYEGRAITGGVDVEFGIGPLYYNFVDVRYIGEPVLRGRILAPSRNVTIINQTVNVTNITYNNSIVYNYGPDYNRLNQYSTRPIQRLTLQRETTVGAELGQGRKGNLNRVSGNQLTVVAPTIQKSQQQIAPKQVKAKVEKPTIEHGWQGVQNRQQLEAEMKQENPKNISAPSFQPQKNRKREAVAGAGQTAEQGTRAPAEQQGAAAQNTGAAAQQPAQPQQPRRAEQGDRNAKRAEAQHDRPGIQNRKNRRDAAESAAPQAGGSPSEQAQQTENQRAERPQNAQQRRAQRTRQNTPQAETAQPEREQAVDRAQQAQERNAQRAGQNEQQAEAAQRDREHGTERPQRPRKTQQAERDQQPDTERPDNNRARRTERTQQAPEAQQTEREKPAEQANRPQRAERPQQNRRTEQARPQEQSAQGNQTPDNQRKGKKKKPSEEPSPQP